LHEALLGECTFGFPGFKVLSGLPILFLEETPSFPIESLMSGGVFLFLFLLVVVPGSRRLAGSGFLSPLFPVAAKPVLVGSDLVGLG